MKKIFLFILIFSSCHSKKVVINIAEMNSQQYDNYMYAAGSAIDSFRVKNNDTLQGCVAQAEMIDVLYENLKDGLSKFTIPSRNSNLIEENMRLINKLDTLKMRVFPILRQNYAREIQSILTKEIGYDTYADLKSAKEKIVSRRLVGNVEYDSLYQDNIFLYILSDCLNNPSICQRIFNERKGELKELGFKNMRFASLSETAIANLHLHVGVGNIRNSYTDYHYSYHRKIYESYIVDSSILN